MIFSCIFAAPCYNTLGVEAPKFALYLHKKNGSRR